MTPIFKAAAEYVLRLQKASNNPIHAFYFIFHLSDYDIATQTLAPLLPILTQPTQLLCFNPLQAPLDLHQIILHHLQPHQQLIQDTTRKIIKILAKLDDRTVFCAGKFRDTMSLQYLPFSAVTIFNIVIRDGILKRADMEFEEQVKREKKRDRVCHLLDRSIVDAIRPSMMSPVEGAPDILVSPGVPFQPIQINWSAPPTQQPWIQPIQQAQQPFAQPMDKKKLLFEQKLREFRATSGASRTTDHETPSDSTLTNRPQSQWMQLLQLVSSNFSDHEQPRIEYDECIRVEETSSLSLLFQHSTSPSSQLYRARIQVIGDVISGGRFLETREEALEDAARLANDFIQAYIDASNKTDTSTESQSAAEIFDETSKSTSTQLLHEYCQKTTSIQPQFEYDRNPATARPSFFCTLRIADREFKSSKSHSRKNDARSEASLACVLHLAHVLETRGLRYANEDFHP